MINLADSKAVMQLVVDADTSGLKEYAKQLKETERLEKAQVAAINRLEKEGVELSANLKKVKGDLSALGYQFKTVTRDAAQAGGALSEIKGKIGSLIGNIGASTLSVAGLGLAVGKLSKDIFTYGDAWDDAIGSQGEAVKGLFNEMEGLISIYEIAKAKNKLAGDGFAFASEKMNELAIAAVELSRRLDIDPTDAFKNVIDGVRSGGKGLTEILRNLGLNIELVGDKSQKTALFMEALKTLNLENATAAQDLGEANAKLKNEYQALAGELGKELMPLMKGALDLAVKSLKGWKQVITEMRKANEDEGNPLGGGGGRGGVFGGGLSKQELLQQRILSLQHQYNEAINAGNIALARRLRIERVDLERSQMQIGRRIAQEVQLRSIMEGSSGGPQLGPTMEAFKSGGKWGAGPAAAAKAKGGGKGSRPGRFVKSEFSTEGMSAADINALLEGGRQKDFDQRVAERGERENRDWEAMMAKAKGALEVKKSYTEAAQASKMFWESESDLYKINMEVAAGMRSLQNDAVAGLTQGMLEYASSAIIAGELSARGFRIMLGEALRGIGTQSAALSAFHMAKYIGSWFTAVPDLTASVKFGALALALGVAGGALSAGGAGARGSLPKTTAAGGAAAAGTGAGTGTESEKGNTYVSNIYSEGRNLMDRGPTIPSNTWMAAAAPNREPSGEQGYSMRQPIVNVTVRPIINISAQFRAEAGDPAAEMIAKRKIATDLITRARL